MDIIFMHLYIYIYIGIFWKAAKPDELIVYEPFAFELLSGKTKWKALTVFQVQNENIVGKYLEIFDIW